MSNLYSNILYKVFGSKKMQNFVYTTLKTGSVFNK